jgi:hypothetical protein
MVLHCNCSQRLVRVRTPFGRRKGSVLEALERILDRIGRHPVASFVGFLLVYLVYFFSVRAIGLPGVVTDDFREVVLAQDWAGGYIARQPPLYTWIVVAIGKVLGHESAYLHLLRFSLIGCFLTIAFLLARRLFSDGVVQVFAALSFLLIYQIGFMWQQMYTHTGLLQIAILGTVWALIRLVDRATIANATIFGLFLGLGMLAKHSFFAFLAILTMALLTERKLVRDIPYRLLPVSIAIALLLYSPYLAFLLSTQDSVAAEVNDTLLGTRPYLENLLFGLWKIPATVAGFLMPLMAFAIVLFLPSLRGKGPMASLSAEAQRGITWSRVLGFAALYGVAILFVGLIGFNMQNFEERHMQALLLTAPFWLAGRLVLFQPGRWRMIAGFAAIALVTLVVMVIRVGEALSSEEPFCTQTCQELRALTRPALADTVKASGFDAGTIIVADPRIGGNLRMPFPDDRVLSLTLPLFRPQTREGADCVLVWSSTNTAALVLPAAPASMGSIKPLMGSMIASRPAGYRSRRGNNPIYWHSQLLDPASEICR